MLERIKQTYILWYSYSQILPKSHKYTIGQRIDSLFIEVIEYTATATFLEKDERLPFVRLAIRKLDTLQVLVMILWETKSIDTKKYTLLGEKLTEAGRMLGGWYGKLKTQTKTPKDTSFGGK